MGADIECEIATPEEPAVKRVHRTPALAAAVIDTERAHDAEPCTDRLAHDLQLIVPDSAEAVPKFRQAARTPREFRKVASEPLLRPPQAAMSTQRMGSKARDP